ncbi:uncharacterized protein LOC113900206 [Bos indicus x Bos taurus]|uniref:uncharacterized protein LOC113900206 n=1 Tax=Bos indicus x Bos taurus TaxID=30522 RepID=UPI000F7D3DD2|nr:uncharacterized protein LOC113900206 [Bos indicus x Bos taurus]
MNPTFLALKLFETAARKNGGREGGRSPLPRSPGLRLARRATCPHLLSARGGAGRCSRRGSPELRGAEGRRPSPSGGGGSGGRVPGGRVLSSPGAGAAGRRAAWQQQRRRRRRQRQPPRGKSRGREGRRGEEEAEEKEREEGGRNKLPEAPRHGLGGRPRAGRAGWGLARGAVAGGRSLRVEKFPQRRGAGCGGGGLSGAVINQAATHHFLPARIQGAGREREDGGAGPFPRPLQAPGRGRARRAPPSLAEPPLARLWLSGRPGGGCERAACGALRRRGGGGAGPRRAPAAGVGGGEAARRGECPVFWTSWKRYTGSNRNPYNCKIKPEGIGTENFSMKKTRIVDNSYFRSVIGAHQHARSSWEYSVEPHLRLCQNTKPLSSYISRMGKIILYMEDGLSYTVQLKESAKDFKVYFTKSRLSSFRLQ